MHRTLGQKLKLIRKTKSFTVNQIAGYLGVSTATLRRYEADITEPDAEFIARFTKFFQISADDLFSQSETKHIKLFTDSELQPPEEFNKAVDDYINNL